MFDDDDDFYGNEDNFDNYDGGFDHDNLDDCYYRDPNELLNDLDGVDDFDPYAEDDDDPDEFPETGSPHHDRYYHQPPYDFYPHDDSMDHHGSIFHTLFPFLLFGLINRDQGGRGSTYLGKEEFGLGCLGLFVVALIIGLVVAIILV